jgi:WD40 repeat protein
MNGKLPKKLIDDAHNSDIMSVCISKDSKYIVSGSKDKSVKVWDLNGE